MAWFHGVGKDGKVVRLELSEKYANPAGRASKDNGVNNVDIKLGDAVESYAWTSYPHSPSKQQRSSHSPPVQIVLTTPPTLASMEPSEPFDLIFVDANKDAYPKYMDLILSKSRPKSQDHRLLKPGRLIVADKVLQHVAVADATPATPSYVEALEVFSYT